ncbi:MAG: four helix bundle protein [Desulfobacteraceae bacterium]
MSHQNNKAFAQELEKRTLSFSVAILHLSAMLPRTEEARVLRTQLSKSATSIGANYREANRARSKADFRSRMGICQAEASETRYWLEIIREMGWLPGNTMETVYQESTELLALFSAIGKRLA